MDAVKGAIKGKILMAIVSAIGVIPILVVGAIVFIGLFVIVAIADTAETSKNSDTNSSTSLPAQVELYRSEVKEICSEYDLTGYVDIILAIIAHETGGIGTDPMQSSLFSFNTKYPQQPGAIKDPIYSIKCGVQQFKHLKELAGLEKVSDTAKVKLVIQAYNFGADYITWALAHEDKGYSKDNAKEYAALKAAEMGVADYGDSNYVYQVMKYWKPKSSGSGGSGGSGGGGTGTGEFIWPMPGYGVECISCHFGDADPNGAPHRGMDIAAPVGVEIVACDNGEVVESVFGHYSWGNYVKIDHGNGYTTLYAHCSDLLVSVGESVKGGETIALCGNTGFSTGPHLHLEVTENGILISAETLL